VTEVAVLGLGEAGGRLARDLVAAGCVVRGWDPLRQSDVPDAASAVRGAAVVLSVNAAAVALDAARSVADTLDPDAVYADVNTTSPGLKRELAGAVPVRFADVALMGTVPVTGLATPALASGAGAARFAELLEPLGMPVEVVDEEPGTAAGLKLLRSVFMKGMAAAAVESVEAARLAGVEERVRTDIASVIGTGLLDRLLEGSYVHAARRADEMRAAAAYLDELGIEPRVSVAAHDWLEQLRAERTTAT
jgi:3-hydroxyisobutyrate dehydrogenase-like beta-hydroxyacid dehydrogenase